MRERVSVDFVTVMPLIYICLNVLISAGQVSCAILGKINAYKCCALCLAFCFLSFLFFF